MAIKCLRKEKGLVICEFKGRIDSTKCMEAEKEIMTALEGAEKIIFDLQDVEYVASSFLRICGKASHKVADGKFSIVNVSPAVKKVFRIAGLVERLNLT